MIYFVQKKKNLFIAQHPAYRLDVEQLETSIKCTLHYVKYNRDRAGRHLYYEKRTKEFEVQKSTLRVPGQVIDFMKEVLSPVLVEPFEEKEYTFEPSSEIIEFCQIKKGIFEGEMNGYVVRYFHKGEYCEVEHGGVTKRSAASVKSWSLTLTISQSIRYWFGVFDFASFKPVVKAFEEGRVKVIL